MKRMNNKKPWLQQYDKYVPYSLIYSKLNIPQILNKSTQEYPEKTCLDYLDNKFTYQQISDASDNLAKWLLFLGIKSGDRVGLIYPNTPQFVISFFAVLKIEAIVVALNPLYTKTEFAKIINECEVNCVLCMDEHVQIIQDLSSTADIRVLIASSKEDFLTPKSINSIGKITCLDHEIPSYENPISFSRCVNENIQNITLDYSFSSDQPAVYQYSGGTTGTPKAAIGLHKNLVANTMQFMTWCDLQKAEEVFLAAIPLYHVYGMVLAMVLAVRLAACIVLIPNARDIDYLLQTISEREVTFFPGVPNLYAAILQNPSVRSGKYNLRTVKACISGSAPLHPKIKKEFEMLTNGKLVEGYGLSEAPTATHCNPLFGDNRPGSFGLPLPDVDCKIVDVDDDRKVKQTGETGELLIYGPQIMFGYYNNPQETKKSLNGGWLHTGDIVRMDDDGYFYFVDRKKDVIKIGGFQVWPTEIEEVISTIPGVTGSVVAGVQNEIGEEKVIAWLVLQQSVKLTSEEIRNYCRQYLAAYKIPKEIYFIDEIPRTGVGKILRRELVRIYKEKRA